MNAHIKLIAMMGTEAIGPKAANLDAAVAHFVADPMVVRVVLNRPLVEQGSPFHAVLELAVFPAAGARVVQAVEAGLGVGGRCALYTVHEAVRRDYERTWMIGEPSPGGKLIATVLRKPGLTEAAFVAHWSGPHAEIALANPVSVWRYVQNVVIARSGGASPNVDGIVEMHYRDLEALKNRMLVAPSETRRGLEDAQSFMDLGRSESAMTQEYVIKDVLGRN